MEKCRLKGLNLQNESTESEPRGMNVSLEKGGGGFSGGE